jgi:hypothetical protein
MLRHTQFGFFTPGRPIWPTSLLAWSRAGARLSYARTHFHGPFLRPPLRQRPRDRDCSVWLLLFFSCRSLGWDSVHGGAAQGTRILEQPSWQGRTRFGLAPDGLAEVKPFRYALSIERSLVKRKPEFARLRAWCCENYLNLVSGKASLVEQSGSSCSVSGTPWSFA